MIPAHISNAAVQGDKDAVAAWLDEHPQSVDDVNAQGASLLLLCVYNTNIVQDTHPELVRYLLSRGADPNHMCYINDDEVEGWMHPLFSICMATCSHAPQIVACLLNAGADPNLRLADRLDQNGEPSNTYESNSTPLLESLRTFLGNLNRSGQLSVVVRLLKAGASLDTPGLSAEEVIAEEERRWAALVENNVHFRAAKALIRGVRAAGSWKKYCRARCPHREILGLRSLAMRGYIAPYQRRRTRGAEYKIAIAFVARLGDNGIVWNILSFWRDPDDVEEVAVPDNDGVRVVRVYD